MQIRSASAVQELEYDLESWVAGVAQGWAFELVMVDIEVGKGV